MVQSRMYHLLVHTFLFNNGLGIKVMYNIFSSFVCCRFVFTKQTKPQTTHHSLNDIGNALSSINGEDVDDNNNDNDNKHNKCLVNSSAVEQ